MAKAPRLTLGLDIFECICGELVIMSRKCPACGRTNADVLSEKAKAEPQEKPKSKIRPPAKTGRFFKSFCFKNKES
jgi:hypothetical protein